MDGSDGTRKDTEDTTLVQIEELERTIRALPFVTKLSPVGARNSHGHGYQVSLRCPSCEEYGSCGKKQEPPVQVSSRNPTELACLQELLKRLQDRHVQCAEAVAKKAAADAASPATVDPDTPNVLQAMMKLEQAKNRAEAANKVALEAEKEKDAAESADHQNPLSFLHARASCHVFLLCFLVYRGTMQGGRSAVGARHARVCVAEDTDPSPVDRISWWKVVRAPSRPFGQKTNLLSQHHQGFGIVT